ncbi:MAG: hypothetical protein ACRELD_07790 [Longimicrobiales bacterium]
MAAENDRVMQMVEQELQKNPDTTNEELLAKAKKISPAVGKLSARQFNARYPLQVKRRKAPRGRKRRGAAKRGGRKSATKRRRTSAVTRAGAKRTRATSAPAAASRAARTDSGRSRVRDILVQFARDLSAADDVSDVVNVIANVDTYVDRVLRAAAAR